MEPVTRVAVVVTFLRMEWPPLDPVPPLPERMRLVQVETPTVGFYRYLYNTVGADYVWWLRRTMPDRELASLLANRAVTIHVLYDGGEPAGEVEGVQHLVRQVGALVGADGEDGALGGQGVERRLDAREWLAGVGAMVAVVGDEAFEEARAVGLGELDAGGLEAALHQPAGALADERADLVSGQGGYAFLGQQDVERAGEVQGGVHQGAVEVEGDDGAGERVAHSGLQGVRPHSRFSRAAARLGKARGVRQTQPRNTAA